MKIYLYGESCASKGQVWCPRERFGESESDAENHGDLFLYGDGTCEELIQQAIDSLAKRYDTRAGGAGDSFRWLCDRNVLEYMDGPEVDYDETIRAWLPVIQETVSD